MQCREVNELLSPYLDGVLNSVKREIISAHLAVCPGCRADFQALSEVVGVLKALPLVELPAGFTADVRMRMNQLIINEDTPGVVQFSEFGREAISDDRDAALPPAVGAPVSFLKNLIFGKWSVSVALAAALFLSAGVTTMVYGPPSQWGSQGLLQKVVFSDTVTELSVTGNENVEKNQLNSINSPGSGVMPQHRRGENAAPLTVELKTDYDGGKTAFSVGPVGQPNSAPREQKPGGILDGPPAGQQQPEFSPAAKDAESTVAQQPLPKTLASPKENPNGPVRTATLSVAADDFGWFSGKAENIALSSGGVVLPPGEDPKQMTIRVPASRFDAVVGSLREIGQVQLDQMTQNGGGSSLEGKLSSAPRNLPRQGIKMDGSAGEIGFAVITIKAR